MGLEIYTVLDTAYPKDKITHDRMHTLYKSQKFIDATKLCKQLKGKFDGQMDGYYDMWIERCEYMITQDLPESWSGIFYAQTK